MDLRGNLNAAQHDRALSVIDYQPFILSDGIQTGCACSKMYGIEITKPRLIFHRNEFDLEEWERITDADARLRRMHDVVSEISRRYVGGTLLHLDLGAADQPFPWRFNCSVRLSKGLLYYGLEEMGLRQIFELPWSDDGCRRFSMCVSKCPIYRASHGMRCSRPGNCSLN